MRSQTLLNAIQSWTDAFPPHTVAVDWEPIPEDEAYEEEITLTMRPANPDACPIMLHINKPTEEDSTFGFALDHWKHIAQRSGLAVRLKHEKLFGLYVEPFGLSAEKALLICRQVAAGDVEMSVGVRKGRLVSTRGCVRLPSGPFPMHGLGEHWLCRLGAKLGLAEIREQPYASWT